MFIVGIVIAALIGFGLFNTRSAPTNQPLLVRRTLATAVVFLMATMALVMVENTANAAIVPTVPLGTAANYSVLAATTVTNTGNSILDRSLGLSPGSSVTGFPPGIVNAPGVIDVANAVALQGQSDLTVAYNNAAGRTVNTVVAGDLVGLTLVGGVYAGASQAPLSLTGTLTLDGENNPDSVFIFQTDSTLITASGSNVSMINGAQECNVFWQVGSSATLGSGSTFVGNILALTSITVETNVTVQGRALARTAAVTLDDDTFNQPSCAQAPPGTTSTTSTTASGGVSTTGTSGVLPLTGWSMSSTLFVALIAITLGAVVVVFSRRDVVMSGRQLRPSDE
jgi:type VI secretion system secreted protein VgrG